MKFAKYFVSVRELTQIASSYTTTPPPPEYIFRILFILSDLDLSYVSFYLQNVFWGMYNGKWKLNFKEVFSS